jgi:hypothetical protein
LLAGATIPIVVPSFSALGFCMKSTGSAGRLLDVTLGEIVMPRLIELTALVLR